MRWCHAGGGRVVTSWCRAASPRRSPRHSAHRRPRARGTRSRLVAPTYVQELRTPATMASRRSSTLGCSGSRYIRAVEMPSPNRPLRARSNGVSVTRTQADRAGRGHAEALLVEPALVVAVRVAGRLVRAGEPRTDHDVGRAGRERERDVAGVAYAAVGPDVPPSSRARAAHSSTAENCGRPTAGHHPRRAHGARPDADLHDVGAGLDQVA